MPYVVAMILCQILLLLITIFRRHDFAITPCHTPADAAAAYAFPSPPLIRRLFFATIADSRLHDISLRFFASLMRATFRHTPADFRC